MKKIIAALMIFASGISSIFASGLNTYVTGAFNYGIFTERAEDATTKLYTTGFDISIASYFNENWGFYLNTDYNFTNKAETTSDNVTITIDNSDFDYWMILSCIAGPAFKINLSDYFELFGAAGFHFAETCMTSDYADLLNFSFGIGGDAGIRFIPENIFYVTGGILFSHDFYTKGETYTGNKTNSIEGHYNFGSFRPYIGVGYRLFEHIY